MVVVLEANAQRLVDLAPSCGLRRGQDLGQATQLSYGFLDVVGAEAPIFGEVSDLRFDPFPLLAAPLELLGELGQVCASFDGRDEGGDFAVDLGEPRVERRCSGPGERVVLVGGDGLRRGQ